MSDKQKIEELMKPRYKVIADYPQSDYPIGHTHTPNGWMTAEFFDKYPHLFKSIGWWEEREEYFWMENSKPLIPLFVSNIGKNVYGSAWVIDLKDGSFTLVVGEDKTKANLSNYIPATFEEYNEYLSQTQDK